MHRGILLQLEHFGRTAVKRFRIRFDGENFRPRELFHPQLFIRFGQAAVECFDAGGKFAFGFKFAFGERRKRRGADPEHGDSVRPDTGGLAEVPVLQVVHQLYAVAARGADRRHGKRHRLHVAELPEPHPHRGQRHRRTEREIGGHGCPHPQHSSNDQRRNYPPHTGTYPLSVIGPRGPRPLSSFCGLRRWSPSRCRPGSSWPARRVPRRS